MQCKKVTDKGHEVQIPGQHCSEQKIQNTSVSKRYHFCTEGDWKSRIAESLEHRVRNSWINQEVSKMKRSSRHKIHFSYQYKINHVVIYRGPTIPK